MVPHAWSAPESLGPAIVLSESFPSNGDVSRLGQEIRTLEEILSDVKAEEKDRRKRLLEELEVLSGELESAQYGADLHQAVLSLNSFQHLVASFDLEKKEYPLPPALSQKHADFVGEWNIIATAVGRLIEEFQNGVMSPGVLANIRQQILDHHLDSTSKEFYQLLSAVRRLQPVYKEVLTKLKESEPTASLSQKTTQLDKAFSQLLLEYDSVYWGTLDEASALLNEISRTLRYEEDPDIRDGLYRKAFLIFLKMDGSPASRRFFRATGSGGIGEGFFLVGDALVAATSFAVGTVVSFFLDGWLAKTGAIVGPPLVLGLPLWVYIFDGLRVRVKNKSAKSYRHAALEGIAKGLPPMEASALACDFFLND